MPQGRAQPCGYVDNAKSVAHTYPQAPTTTSSINMIASEGLGSDDLRPDSREHHP
jgi:hypothetical protein